jgi:hypothetical protein
VTDVTTSAQAKGQSPLILIFIPLLILFGIEDPTNHPVTVVAILGGIGSS